MNDQLIERVERLLASHEESRKKIESLETAVMALTTERDDLKNTLQIVNSRIETILQHLSTVTNLTHAPKTNDEVL